ncbi:hypothetical protein QJV44_gp24 [Serratia phage vB_SmaS_Tlacuache]|uniref:Uncharacterized protein n=1 Tax=Serratia phage vB_SmaS_Tlacuache TaxID=2894809 RepID=A0AAE8YWY4_9CAUD|nr:hypothetical protein QJV44_gp24 [Serratia phage vB_SmaS_Tlacuache]UGO51438.1 hypothetical protein TLACUACHE_24 [Serratia phage vB_SmaS_Tlacuache]
MKRLMLGVVLVLSAHTVEAKNQLAAFDIQEDVKLICSKDADPQSCEELIMARVDQAMNWSFVAGMCKAGKLLKAESSNDRACANASGQYRAIKAVTGGSE